MSMKNRIRTPSALSPGELRVLALADLRHDGANHEGLANAEEVYRAIVRAGTGDAQERDQETDETAGAIVE
jgi:hypothetical protein